METTSKTQNMFDKISAFIETQDLQWEKLCGIRPDGAPTMLGSKAGFQIRIKQIAAKQKVYIA